MTVAAMVTIRPEREEDYARVAELLSMGYPEPVSAAQVREWRVQDSLRTNDYHVVAVDETGRVVGYAHALRDEWAMAGLFWLHVGVEPPARGRGIGTRLFVHVEGVARERGATIFRAEARDVAPEGLRFAQHQGFRVERHIFESTLNLGTFDETPFVAKLAAVEASGIRFASLAELGDTEETRHTLHALNETAVMDVPGSDRTPRPYDAFAGDVFKAGWFRAEGQIVALDGETWIGMSAAGIFDESRSAYNMFTGVLPAYRGRGIALALKLLALRYARQAGATYVRADAGGQPQAGLCAGAGLLSPAV